MTDLRLDVLFDIPNFFNNLQSFYTLNFEQPPQFFLAERVFHFKQLIIMSFFNAFHLLELQIHGLYEGVSSAGGTFLRVYFGLGTFFFKVYSFKIFFFWSYISTGQGRLVISRLLNVITLIGSGGDFQRSLDAFVAFGAF